MSLQLQSLSANNVDIKALDAELTLNLQGKSTAIEYWDN